MNYLLVIFGVGLLIACCLLVDANVRIAGLKQSVSNQSQMIDNLRLERSGLRDDVRRLEATIAKSEEVMQEYDRRFAVIKQQFPA